MPVRTRHIWQTGVRCAVMDCGMWFITGPFWGVGQQLLSTSWFFTHQYMEVIIYHVKPSSFKCRLYRRKHTGNAVCDKQSTFVSWNRHVVLVYNIWSNWIHACLWVYFDEHLICPLDAQQLKHQTHSLRHYSLRINS